MASLISEPLSAYDTHCCAHGWSLVPCSSSHSLELYPLGICVSHRVSVIFLQPISPYPPGIWYSCHSNILNQISVCVYIYVKTSSCLYFSNFFPLLLNGTLLLQSFTWLYLELRSLSVGDMYFWMVCSSASAFDFKFSYKFKSGSNMVLYWLRWRISFLYKFPLFPLFQKFL